MAERNLVLGCRIRPATRRLLEAIAGREKRTLSKTVAALLEVAARERVAQLEAAGGRPSRRTGRSTTKGVERVRQKR